MKLKILALGKKNVINRITRALKSSDCMVTCCNEVSDAINLLKTDKFDLALVDGYMDDVEAACYRITWLYKTPIAVVINGRQDDWDILRKLDADGFIPEEVNNIELISHFTAITRHTTDHIEPAKILVIEDEDQIQETLRLSFQMYWPGTRVFCSGTGEDGVKLARQEKVDAILLDLKLPDISGVEVLEKIRVFSQTPVIIITATRNQEEVVKCIKAGANDFVIKPFKQLELLSRIRRLAGIGEHSVLK
jgi:DNA-binding response OmpR family regulator